MRVLNRTVAELFLSQMLVVFAIVSIFGTVMFIVSFFLLLDIERAVESLYIMTWTGLLTEYILSPHAKSGLDKVTDDTPLEMTETPRAQWSLGRYVSEGTCCLISPF